MAWVEDCQLVFDSELELDTNSKAYESLSVITAAGWVCRTAESASRIYAKGMIYDKQRKFEQSDGERGINSIENEQKYKVLLDGKWGCSVQGEVVTGRQALLKHTDRSWIHRIYLRSFWRVSWEQQVGQGERPVEKAGRQVTALRKNKALATSKAMLR